MAQTQNIMTTAKTTKLALLAIAVIALSATQSLADGKKSNDQSATNAQVQSLEKRIEELERKSGNTARTLERHKAQFNPKKLKYWGLFAVQIVRKIDRKTDKQAKTANLPRKTLQNLSNRLGPPPF